MKTGKKALLLALCAVLLVAATVMGTMAYLVDTKTVENTFTIGSVAITLDEADVKIDGTYEKDENQRVTANAYKLMPGRSYIKDPIVHVVANSEDSWIFVKVENGISAFEAAHSDKYNTISDQITANGWTALENVANVYYKKYEQKNTVEDLKVFEKFEISDTANSVSGWANAGSAKVTITAYAVQADGFTTAKAAWDATYGKSATPTT